MEEIAKADKPTAMKMLEMLRLATEDMEILVERADKKLSPIKLNVPHGTDKEVAKVSQEWPELFDHAREYILRIRAAGEKITHIIDSCEI